MSTSGSHAREASALALAGQVRSLAGRLKRRLREHGSLGDLTPSQVAVLVHLDRDGPATITTLARAEGVRPQSMGATVAVLQAANLVEGRPDPKDGRQIILNLTDACRERVAAGRAAREDWLHRTISAELTPAERDQLATGLTLLDRILAG